MHDMTRPQYQPPRITELGTVAGLTQGNASGSELDQAFPAGTPFSDLTFS